MLSKTIIKQKCFKLEIGLTLNFHVNCFSVSQEIHCTQTASCVVVVLYFFSFYASFSLINCSQGERSIVLTGNVQFEH